MDKQYRFDDVVLTVQRIYAGEQPERDVFTAFLREVERIQSEKNVSNEET